MRGDPPRQPARPAGADRRPEPHLRHAAAAPAAVDFYNERRWLAWDLLCGRVGPGEPMWTYLIARGATPARAALVRRATRARPTSSASTTTSPASAGSTIALDRYPPRAARRPAATVASPTSSRCARWRRRAPGIGPLLEEVWQRYGLPIAVTEAHIDAQREDQLHWLLEIWRAAGRLRASGTDVRAVTVWSLLGSFDWNTLVCESRGYYEPGAFDVRGAGAAADRRSPRSLASSRPARRAAHPVLQGEGWWRRPDRFSLRAGGRSRRPCAARSLSRRTSRPRSGTPILISGASGTLGRAFAAVCARRGLAFRLLDRAAMDIADPASVDAALAALEAVGGRQCQRLRAHRRGRDRARALPPRERARPARCWPSAAPPRRSRLRDLLQRPGVRRHDRQAPSSRATSSRRSTSTAGARPRPRRASWPRIRGAGRAHQRVLRPVGRAQLPGRRRCARWRAASPSRRADDVRVSPTYVPDLVDACLDLLIDGESGLWHLANAGDVSWAEFAPQAAAARDGPPARCARFAARRRGRAQRARPTRSSAASAAGRCRRWTMRWPASSRRAPTCARSPKSLAGPPARPDSGSLSRSGRRRKLRGDREALDPGAGQPLRSSRGGRAA